MNERCQTNHKFIELVVLFEVSCYKQLSPYLEKKKGLYTYLQYTQLLAKKSDLQPFSKSLFSFFLGGWRWFSQMRMRNSTKMRCKEKKNSKRVGTEGLLLESVSAKTEKWVSTTLLREPPQVWLVLFTRRHLPVGACHGRLQNDPFENAALHTRGEGMCKRRLFGCPPSGTLGTGSRAGGHGAVASNRLGRISNCEARLPLPSRAVSCSNSSDRHAPERRFSGA